MIPTARLLRDAIIRSKRKPSPKVASPKTTNMILSILKKHAPVGRSTKEIFDEAISTWPPASPPSIPEPYRSSKGVIIQPMNQPLDHPIRSVRFLKFLLNELKTGRVVKISYISTDEESLTGTERSRMMDKKGNMREDPRAFRWTLNEQGIHWENKTVNAEEDEGESQEESR
ncbi:hypothetical protein R3P38DRAFT_2831001 [Favolaschia claudopus]|uniref:Uncharacterized protein n=1 Tax=Favolaschia claudopus TaxID=2862362 RepID=A0AAW0EB44_9AGAR